MISPLAQALTDMNVALTSAWYALGRIYSNNAKPFEYKNNPQATQDVMEDVHHLTGGLTIVFLQALIEAYIDPNDPMWNDFLNHLSTEDQHKLTAFKHVRNTMAHGFDGTRARRNMTSYHRFDEVMSRPHAGDTIQNVKYHDAIKITLQIGVGVEFFQFLKDITEKALIAELSP